MSFEQIEANVFGCLQPIVLPGSTGTTGDTGPAGADGVALLYNDFTRTPSTNDTNPKTYNTYQLSAGNLSSNGDSVNIEGMFTIATGMHGTFSLKFGSATVATYQVQLPLLAPAIIKLEALVSRTGAATQKVEGKYTIVGYPDAVKTIPITTASENLANAVDINLVGIKAINGVAADIYSEYLRVKKYKI